MTNWKVLTSADPIEINSKQANPYINLLCAVIHQAVNDANKNIIDRGKKMLISDKIDGIHFLTTSRLDVYVNTANLTVRSKFIKDHYKKRYNIPSNLSERGILNFLKETI